MKLKNCTFFTELINCSRTLNIMVILGFMINYMLRVNFTIAIVDIVEILKHNYTVITTTNLSTKYVFGCTNVSAIIWMRRFNIMYLKKYEFLKNILL